MLEAGIDGKRVLITGSSSGIGFELAKGFCAAGATVILNGRNVERLEMAARNLQQLSPAAGNVLQVCFDVTDEAAAQAGVEALGRIDVLVNNAGIQRRGPLDRVATFTWDEVIRTNLSSAFWMGRAVVSQMIERKAGKILNICSLMSDYARAGTGPYTAAKGGLKMLTKAMCADWAQHNIQINGIAPGYFLTEMTRPLAENPEFDGWVKRRTPTGRWGLPQELIGAALFLCSDAASFINGQIVCVDGGMTSVL
jgi:gluconate 5-dehydrogenase